MNDCDCFRCITRRRGARPWQGKISRSALRGVRERLGVTGEVRVKRGSCTGSDPEVIAAGYEMPPYEEGATTFGCHAMLRDGTHVIEIHRDVGDEEANAILLHELTHAAQTERYGSRKFQTMYQRAHYAFGYDRNPYEAEANRNMRELADEFKVVVA